MQDCTQREDIDTEIDGLPPHLFGRHLPKRANRRAHVGHDRERGRTRGLFLIGLDQFGYPEVEDFDATVARGNRFSGLRSRCTMPRA